MTEQKDQMTWIWQISPVKSLLGTWQQWNIDINSQHCVMVCFSLTMLRKYVLLSNLILSKHCWGKTIIYKDFLFFSSALNRFPQLLVICIVQSVKLSKSVLCEEIRSGPAEAIGLYFIFMSKEVKQTPI